MPWGFAAAAALTVIGGAISANGQVQAGKAAAAGGIEEQQADEYKAGELRQQAGQERAGASHTAEIKSLNTRFVLSALQARAAAGGSSTASPDVVGLRQGIAGRGEYDVLSALATGENRARGLEDQAHLSDYEGKVAAQGGRLRQSAANTGAMSTIFSTGSSLFSKYGFDQPSSGGMDPAAVKSGPYGAYGW